MKKLLFISNIADRITNFTLPSVLAGQQLGYDVHMAANFSGFKGDPAAYNITLHHIDIRRFPFHPGNLRACRQMLALMRRERFDAVHCNTPVGGALGRLCGAKAKVSTVIYTAHGFHFYQGAPLINRVVYKRMEQILAHKTDAIITMNREDERAARSLRLRCPGQVYHVPGVGVNTSEYAHANVDRTAVRTSLSVGEQDILLISMGDLNKGKNHETAIRAVALTCRADIHLLICGKGPLRASLEALAVRLGVDKRVHFLGFRSDIKELLRSSDIFLFTSFREGMPRALMEAMSARLPVICSRIRGNVDLIAEGENGYLAAPADASAFAEAIGKLADNPDLRRVMGEKNGKAIAPCDEEIVKKRMVEIYTGILRNP